MMRMMARRQILWFMAIASLVILAIALLDAVNLLPLRLDVTPEKPVVPSAWHQCVAIAGLVMPVGVWFFLRHHPTVRAILSGYLVVLLAQIITEIILLQWAARGMSVVVGTVYSAFRLVQLWQGQRVLRANESQQEPWIRAGLWALFFIWGVNLIQFLLFRWPAILGFSY